MEGTALAYVGSFCHEYIVRHNASYFCVSQRDNVSYMRERKDGDSDTKAA